MTFIGIVMAIFMAGDGASTAVSEVEGRWLTPEEKSIIEVFDCGDGTPCGRIEWVLHDGENLITDKHNRNPELKGRPLEGVMILHGFEPSGDGWDDGKIYNPENGKTYTAKLRRNEDGNLLVKGCVGPICRGMLWTEAPSD